MSPVAAGSSIHLTAADYGVIFVYFLITSSLGLYFAGRWNASEDYFLAGRSLIWPLIGLSLFATKISTEHFVGLGAGASLFGRPDRDIFLCLDLG